MVIREGKTPGDEGDTPTRAIPLGDNISFKDGLLILTSFCPKNLFQEGQIA
jgi:hypothetical protein